VTGPAKVGHVGSQNLTNFQTSGSYKILFQHGTAIKISELIDNIFGFTTCIAYTIQIPNFSIEICLIK